MSVRVETPRRPRKVVRPFSMLRANAHQPPSPDLSQEAQAALRQFSLERLMAYGVDYSDAIELRARVSSGEDWREAAAGLAETCLSPPQHDVAMPSVRTQARRLLRASALLRMSQMMMIEDGPERAAIFADAARLYTEASALLGTPERLVVPTPNGPLVGCPMPHSTTYQMVIWLRPDETPTLDAGSVAALFRDRTGRDDLRLREVRWLSLSRPHLRLVDRFRVGRVFLAGDAAHVHPFWGAQGLNTSIQDAFNLGWKLALVLQGAPEPLLDTYEAERRPVAEAMLKVVSDLSAMPAEKQVRGRRTRQLDVGYRQSPLSRGGDGGRPDAKVKAGDRVPDARFGSAGEDRRRLFEAFQGPHFTLLLFGDAPAPRRAPRWPTSIVRVDRIPSGAGESYGIEGDAAVLVRPDNYVAFVAADPGSEALENWFDALRDVGEGAAPSAGPQAAHAEAGR